MKYTQTGKDQSYSGGGKTIGTRQHGGAAIKVVKGKQTQVKNSTWGSKTKV